MKIFICISILVFFFANISFAIDSDKDGIDDIVDKFPQDFDNDGMPDRWEVMNGLRYDIVDSNLDNDNDGLSNLEEFVKGTDPNSADSDGDEVTDYSEVQNGSNPLKKDNVLWPFIVIPFLIIIFVLVLFLVHKYQFDITFKEKFSKYFVKEKKDDVNKPITYEQPKIVFRSLADQQKEKQKQMQKVMNAFGVDKEKKNLQKPSNKDAFERLKRLR